jgi:hypothetical protein
MESMKKELFDEETSFSGKEYDLQKSGLNLALPAIFFMTILIALFIAIDMSIKFSKTEDIRKENLRKSEERCNYFCRTASVSPNQNDGEKEEERNSSSQQIHEKTMELLQIIEAE